MSFNDTLVSAKAGDSQAEQLLFEKWRSLLTIHAAQAMGPALQAKLDPADVVQESLAQASLDLSQFNGQHEAQWLRWLQTIVVGCAAKARRHHLTQKRDAGREVAVTMDLSVVEQTPLEQLEQWEEARETAQALSQLPDEMRRAIVARVVHRLPWAEIADQLGKSETAARALWTRGVRLLRDQLTN